MSPEPLAALGFRTHVRIVTHAVALPGSRVARRQRWVKHRQPVERARRPRSRHSRRFGEAAWPGQSRSGWLARFENDHDLTGIKLALVGLVVLFTMALEVPW